MTKDELIKHAYLCGVKDKVVNNMTLHHLNCIEHEVEFDIPREIIEYCRDHDANLQINYNWTDAINGYGIICHKSLCIYRYAEWCTREKCNYHSIYHPLDDESRCQRHRIERDYTPVFAWSDGNWSGRNEESLEEAFAKWLKEQEK